MIRAVCLDFGDTLADETTEIKDSRGVTLRAELLPDAADVIRELNTRGYPLALVADGFSETYANVLAQHGIDDCFAVVSASEQAGAEKPSAPVFVRALEALGIEPGEYRMTVMVGNRLDRDIRGSRALGMISVLLTAANRNRSQPSDEGDTPDHAIARLAELPALLDQIERELQGSR